MERTIIHYGNGPGVSPLPEKTGYRRVHKRTRGQEWVWFYRFIPEPIFDNRTHYKRWNAGVERWEKGCNGVGTSVIDAWNVKKGIRTIRRI
jgi:hypothetical protein